MNTKNTKNEIYFNFSYYALRLLGKGLYSNAWTAIAELVANGFDANAKHVKVYINATNKEKSVIEIFDDGYGMGYDDLVNKYSLIGRDKRDSDDIDEETKKQLMGRKGIGKLAALYLSKRYYLISKTKKECSAWCLNSLDVKDSDVPRLDRLDEKNIPIESGSFWEKNKTGTMVKLTDVDLRNFGVQSLKGLKARLADFFQVDILDGKMEVAFLTHHDEKIVFEKVEKETAFKNMYALFNNTSRDIESELRKSLNFKSSVEHVFDKERPVVFFDEKKFSCTSGEQCFLLGDGRKTKKGIPYKLEGWIGIHASIDKEIASKNDPRYLKNKVYQPNKLRLYVRKKLAVENFLDYLHNTQAFSNYIEGEISFDILDDDRLPDIATTNRQGFDEDSDRIKLLVEILKPIVGALIRQRVSIGEKIKEEEDAYWAEQERIANEKAEKERQKAERAERDREKAEQAEKKAQFEAHQAKINQNIAEQETKKTKEQLAKKVEQLKIVTSLSSQDIDLVTNLHHQTNVVANNIQSLITQFIRHNRNNDFLEYKTVEELLGKISFEDSKIIAFSKFGIKKIFDDFSTKAEYDIVEYLKNYIEKISSQFTSQTQLFISFKSSISQFSTFFAPIDISIIVDNMVSNARKAHATALDVSVDKMGDCVEIKFTSNKPFDKTIENLDDIFEKGFSTTRSTGVGLYHIKNISDENGWEIIAERDGNSAIFVLTIHC